MIGCLPSCENKPSAPLAQSVEHLPFKQGVRGSNPRRGTKKRSTALRCFSFWHLVDSKRAPTSHGPTGHRSRAQQSGGLLHKRESNPLRRPTPRWGGRRNHVASDLHPRFPPHTPLSLPHREAIPSNTTKLGIPHGASLFGIWWIRNERPASCDPTGRRSRTQYSTRPPGQHPPIFLLEKSAHLWYNILTSYSKRRFAEGSP